MHYLIKIYNVIILFINYDIVLLNELYDIITMHRRYKLYNNRNNNILYFYFIMPYRQNIGEVSIQIELLNIILTMRFNFNTINTSWIFKCMTNTISIQFCY
jgi:hypothetical protein